MYRALVFTLLISQNGLLHAQSDWQQILEVNKQGTVIKGQKSALIEAIRKGKNVRVYWKGSYVEHLTDAHFLTIIEGEVFAQTPTIKGQRPTQKPPSVELRENEWTGLISTKGKFHSKWFIQ